MPYTGHDNCHPGQRLADDRATVASAAAQYNPVFYWIVGTPARAFDCATSLYAMRVTAAVLCSCLLALASLSISFWSTSLWPMPSVAVTMTPVAVYTTMLPAPNGVEI